MLAPLLNLIDYNTTTAQSYTKVKNEAIIITYHHKDTVLCTVLYCKSALEYYMLKWAQVKQRLVGNVLTLSGNVEWHAL